MNKKLFITLVVVLVLLVAGAVAYYFYGNVGAASAACAGKTSRALTACQYRANYKAWISFLKTTDTTKFQNILNSLSGVPAPTTPTPTDTITNVKFYPTVIGNLYSDKESEANHPEGSTCVVTDMAGKNIHAKYQNKNVYITITKGKNFGCPPDILVEQGTYITDPNPPTPTPTPGVICPADVKQCPDGSYVNRDPNNTCAFKSCPASTPAVKGAVITVETFTKTPLKNLTISGYVQLPCAYDYSYTKQTIIAYNEVPFSGLADEKAQLIVKDSDIKAKTACPPKVLYTPPSDGEYGYDARWINRVGDGNPVADKDWYFGFIVFGPNKNWGQKVYPLTANNIQSIWVQSNGDKYLTYPRDLNYAFTRKEGASATAYTAKLN